MKRTNGLCCPECKTPIVQDPTFVIGLLAHYDICPENFEDSSQLYLEIPRKTMARALALDKEFFRDEKVEPVKVKELPRERRLSINTKYVTSLDAIKKLEGKLLGLVDISFTDESQRSAMKAAIRQYVWGIGKMWLPEKSFDELRGMLATHSPAEDVMSNEELGQ